MIPLISPSFSPSFPLLTASLFFPDAQFVLYTISLSNYMMIGECAGCYALEKQARVMEVELQFEIKKLSEDMALQKVRLEIAHQKEAKKWADRLAFTRNERELENKSWMEKYDAVTQAYELKLKKTERACAETLAHAQQQMAQAQHSSAEQTEARLSREVAEIKQENEEYKQKLLLSKEEQKKYLLKIHEEELTKQAEKHRAEVAALEEEKRALQQTVTAFETAERNSKLVTAEIAEQLQQKKVEAEALRENIRTLEHRIKFHFEAELASRDKQIAKMRVEHDKACRKMEDDFAAQREELSKELAREMNQNIEKMLEKEFVKCMEYEKQLKALDERREREIALYQRQLETMRTAAEERLIPKSQFHEEISTLKGRLSSKEKDIERAKEQIKQCKLEIENNEEILTRFFKANNSHTHTAPDIFINTPKKKDYKIKKNRVSVSGAGGLLDIPGKFSNVTSMECLDKTTTKDFESFRIL